MNKSLTEIIQEIQGAKAANVNLADIDSTSKASVWKQFIEVVAYVIWNFQESCRLYLDEIMDLIKKRSVPTRRWYRNEVLKYQDGFGLVYDDDNYTISFSPYYEENGTMVLASDEKIEESKIIKFCSVTKSKTESKILIKIASEINGEIVPLTEEQAKAVAYYVSEFEATGDHINIVNYRPDILLPQYDICYDPLVLTSNGMNKISARYPVVDSINKFLKNLDFDGEFSVHRFEEAICNVPGVTDLLRKSISSSWIDVNTGDYGLPQPILIAKIPKSGHYKIDDWSGLNYIIKQAQE